MMMLPRRAVRERLGISDPTLRMWIRSGRFPPPIILGPRKHSWDSAVVDAWLAERAGVGLAAAADALAAAIDKTVAAEGSGK